MSVFFASFSNPGAEILLGTEIESGRTFQAIWDSIGQQSDKGEFFKNFAHLEILIFSCLNVCVY